MKGLLLVYSVALLFSITTFSLGIVSLGSNWVTQATTPPVPVRLSTSYGLFSVCTSDSYLPGVVECRPFPQRERDCPTKRSEKLQGGGMGTYSGEGNKEGQEEERWDLCDSWITAGYAHQLSLVFSIGALLSIILTLIGAATVGRGFRTEKLRSGWKLVAGLLSLQGFCLVVASSLVAYERNHDVRFAYGAHLARAWTMTTVSYALNFTVVAVILLVRVLKIFRIVPGEEGYTAIA